MIKASNLNDFDIIIYFKALNSPAFETSHGNSIVSPMVNRNASERLMKIGSIFSIVWIDANAEMEREERKNEKMLLSVVNLLFVV